ncbi:dihydrodipicolinate synthase family protein [Geomicrobium sp. JCM 19039]|uniref:dihydrodipicolinate synthase family protein n=1 Tax=Geomicrobium sp. JCM 19039 TaxID=1460636 RepID=UPI00045F3CD6|nr:dihydrodipicolinate synthase family protein [Geomicrobium sp. JCM 19039]GAK12273.1 hypothetical protein JCM19039_2031 [Geomicrobium sp. JCM 19039]
MTRTSIFLPTSDRQVVEYVLQTKEIKQAEKVTFHKRIAFSAAHVVADPFSTGDPLKDTGIDWEATLNYRHFLWNLGFAVAEAMDTAQRGMGLEWSQAKTLITRSVKEAQAVNGKIACGAGTDQLDPNKPATLDEIAIAYEEQCEHIEQAGGQVILMASRALARTARSPEDYAYVYGRVLSQVSSPVILHWLGEMFDPSLSGYWGSANLNEAMSHCLDVIREHQQRVDGIKISLLDKQKEIVMRRQLPESVKMYTGDDFNYPELIEGDEVGYSHALLGIFDAIAPTAADALNDLDAGDVAGYRRKMEKTLPLARHIFQKPTFSYKTGIVFLAYLNGHQSHFRMVGGAESARSLLHLSQLFTLADQAGVLTAPQLATERMQQWLKLSGIQQGGETCSKYKLNV